MNKQEFNNTINQILNSQYSTSIKNVMAKENFVVCMSNMACEEWSGEWHLYIEENLKIGAIYKIKDFIIDGIAELENGIYVPCAVIRKATYAEIQAASGLKIGNYVKVVNSAFGATEYGYGDHGWSYHCEKTENVGKVGKIISIYKNYIEVTINNENYAFPSFVLQKTRKPRKGGN